MAFDRLHALGEEKFDKILNLLMRGESAMGLARTIQAQPPKGWGDFQGVAEKTLTQQLNRLRLEAASGMFGGKTAKRIAERAKPNADRFAHISVNTLMRLEELSETQRERYLSLVAREKTLIEAGAITILSTTAMTTNAVAKEYRECLAEIQKVRFNLGLDEYKGPIGTSLRGVTHTTTFPDGMSVQKQVFEAVTTVEQILNARKIPHLIARTE